MSINTDPLSPREALLDLFKSYVPVDERDRDCLQSIRDFVSTDARCCERTTTVGHLTGSAWVVDANGTSVLLVHHRVLNMWVQPGGHADGDTDLRRVALRELEEETGICDPEPLTERLFDVDIHSIPTRHFPDGRVEQEHLHFDLRFAFRAPVNATLRVSSESKAVSWVPLNRIAERTSEHSILRMVEKFRRMNQVAGKVA